MSIMETERKLREMTASLPKAPKPASETVTPEPTVTVLYNGGCPACRFEMERYQRLGGARPEDLAFHNVVADPSPLAPLGLTADRVKRRLHVCLADGGVVEGIDAFILLWRQMPRYSWLARLVALPVLRWGAVGLYNGVLVPVMWRLNRRRERRAANAASRTVKSR